MNQSPYLLNYPHAGCKVPNDTQESPIAKIKAGCVGLGLLAADAPRDESPGNFFASSASSKPQITRKGRKWTSRQSPSGKTAPPPLRPASLADDFYRRLRRPV